MVYALSSRDKVWIWGRYAAFLFTFIKEKNSVSEHVIRESTVTLQQAPLLVWRDGRWEGTDTKGGRVKRQDGEWGRRVNFDRCPSAVLRPVPRGALLKKDLLATATKPEPSAARLFIFHCFR